MTKFYNYYYSSKLIDRNLPYNNHNMHHATTTTTTTFANSQLQPHRLQHVASCTLVICPIAIAYSMGQIIKSVDRERG